LLAHSFLEGMLVRSYYGFSMSYQFLSVMSPSFFVQPVQPCAALPEAAKHLFTLTLSTIQFLLTRPLHSLPYLSGGALVLH
jgi:hypothetical protein